MKQWKKKEIIKIEMNMKKVNEIKIVFLIFKKNEKQRGLGIRPNKQMEKNFIYKILRNGVNG